MRMRRHRIALILLAIAAVYGFVWSDAPWIVSDSAGYLTSAADWLDLRVDTLHDRTPGYPLLLLLTGAGETPGRLLVAVQLALTVACILLLVRLLRAAGVGRTLVACFIGLAVLPPRFAPAGYVLTECWTQFLLVAGVFSGARWFEDGRTRWLLACGLAAGLAALTRPTYALLAVVGLWVWVLLAPRRVGRRPSMGVAAACMLVPTLVMVGGLCLHNLRLFGFPGPSPLFGFNLSTRTLRVLERLPDEEATLREVLIRNRDRDLVERNGTHEGTMFIWGAREELEAATGLTRAELSRRLMHLNLLLIRKAPLEYGVEVGHAMVTYWFPWLPEAANFGSRAMQMLWSLLHFGATALFFAVVGLAAAIAVLLARVGWMRRWIAEGLEPAGLAAIAGAVFALATIFYTMIVSCAVEIGTPRYRGPTDLLILFVTVLGLSFGSRLQRKVEPVAGTGV